MRMTNSGWSTLGLMAAVLGLYACGGSNGSNNGEGDTSSSGDSLQGDSSGDPNDTGDTMGDPGCVSPNATTSASRPVLFVWVSYDSDLLAIKSARSTDQLIGGWVIYTPGAQCTLASGTSAPADGALIVDLASDLSCAINLAETGEVGLYSGGPFDDATAHERISAYVAWGAAAAGVDHIADRANIWTEGDFVTVQASDGAVVAVGDVITSGGWVSEPAGCR